MARVSSMKKVSFEFVIEQQCSSGFTDIITSNARNAFLFLVSVYQGTDFA